MTKSEKLLKTVMKKKQTGNLSEEAIWEIGRVDPDVAGKYIQKLGRKE